MQGKCALVDVYATKPSPIAEWFRYFEVVMGHPDLHRDEQYLWLWLATHCVNRSHQSCSFSYQQISRAVKMSYKAVHCALFRLKLMGFLNGEIPVWYGDIQPDMAKVVRQFTPLPISKEALWRQQIIRKKRECGTPIFETHDKKPVLLNLLG